MTARGWVPGISRAVVTCALTFRASFAVPVAAQSIAVDRRRGEQMLDQIREDLVEHYYDPDLPRHRPRRALSTAPVTGSTKPSRFLGEIFGFLAGVCLDLPRLAHGVPGRLRRVQDVDYGPGLAATSAILVLVDFVDDDSEARTRGLRLGDSDCGGGGLSR